MLPQPSNNATNVSQVSPTSSPQWNASEHSFDPIDLATNLRPIRSTTANPSETAPQTCQGLSQRQTQWRQQQQTSQLQPPRSPMPNSQSSYQSLYIVSHRHRFCNLGLEVLVAGLVALCCNEVLLTDILVVVIGHAQARSRYRSYSSVQ
ncbi:Hypothetical predicted protein, partial [Olea europaea subsp. europaea]